MRVSFDNMTSKVESHFISRIQDGTLKPGERIPPIQSIHKELGVSYGVAAAAIRQLSEKGFIDANRGRGSYVKGEATEGDSPIQTPLFSHSRKQLYHILFEHTSAFDHSMLISSGIQSEAERRGFALKTITSDSLKLADTFKENPPDGIIMGANSKVDQFDVDWSALREQNIPLIYCGNGSTPQHFNNVIFDNHDGVYQSVQYLTQKGHRDIQYIGATKLEDHILRERFKGYQESMLDSGMKPLPHMPWNIHQQTKPVRALLESIKNGTSPTTALIVQNDVMAMEIINLASLLDIKVPEQVSIMGFENITTESSSEMLTSFDFPKIMMGKLAVKMVAEFDPQIQFKRCYSICVKGDVVERLSVSQK